MSEIKVDQLSPRTSSGTVTLGSSGDSLTIPSGVTLTNNGTATGFGKVLQVVKGADSAAFSTTSSTLVDTNITVTITPSSTSSIILLSYNAFYFRSGSGSGDNGITGRDVTRNGTTIFSPFGAPTRTNEADNGFIYDAPSSTSALTYTLRIARASTWTAEIPAGCYMTAIEIAG